MQALVEKTAAYLKEHLYMLPEIPENEKRYRFEHSLRVARLANAIAKAEDADVRIATLAGLLHDVGKFDSETGPEHARVSGRVARPFLESLGLPETDINEICFAIAAHYDGDAGYPHSYTKEAACVTDADNVDRFGPIHLFQYGMAEERTAQELAAYCEKRMARIDGYLAGQPMETAEGNRLFAEACRALHTTLAALKAQAERTHAEDLNWEERA